jgi:hypothetical protein
MEARIGVEPMYKGFADLGLTTWLPRPEAGSTCKIARTAGLSQSPVWRYRPLAEGRGAAFPAWRFTAGATSMVKSEGRSLS